MVWDGAPIYPPVTVLQTPYLQSQVTWHVTARYQQLGKHRAVRDCAILGGSHTGQGTVLVPVIAMATVDPVATMGCGVELCVALFVSVSLGVSLLPPARCLYV